MSATPYLSNLGLSVQQQMRRPEASAFPILFNPATRRIWTSVVSEYPFQSKFTDAESIATDWYNVLNKFIDECAKNSLYPFTEYHQSFNDQSVDKLRDARRAVVKFMNRSKILDLITVRNTHRKAVMTDTGFALIVSGEINLKDPTFPEWILKMPFPRFDIQRDINGRWTKSLGDGATFFVENEHAKAQQRWVIGYEIAVNFFPEIPNKHLPSKQELERFILDVLWMPVLKSMRPFGLSHKLL